MSGQQGFMCVAACGTLDTTERPHWTNFCCFEIYAIIKYVYIICKIIYFWYKHYHTNGIIIYEKHLHTPRTRVYLNTLLLLHVTPLNLTYKLSFKDKLSMLSVVAFHCYNSYSYVQNKLHCIWPWNNMLFKKKIQTKKQTLTIITHQKIYFIYMYTHTNWC